MGLTATLRLSPEEQCQLERIGESYNLNLSDAAAFAFLSGVRVILAESHDGVLKDEVDGLDKAIREILGHSVTGKEGIVYIIKLSNKSIFKVGATRCDVEVRVRTIQTSCPYPVSLYAEFYHADRHAKEREWHELLSAYRMQGEWFDVEQVVMDKMIVNQIVRDYISQGKGNAAMQYWVRPHVVSVLAKELRSLPRLMYCHPLLDAEGGDLA